MKIRYYDTDSKIFINIDDFAALITVLYTYVDINNIKHLPIKQASPTYDCPPYKTTNAPDYCSGIVRGRRHAAYRSRMFTQHTHDVRFTTGRRQTFNKSPPPLVAMALLSATTHGSFTMM